MHPKSAFGGLSGRFSVDRHGLEGCGSLCGKCMLGPKSVVCLSGGRHHTSGRRVIRIIHKKRSVCSVSRGCNVHLGGLCGVGGVGPRSPSPGMNSVLHLHWSLLCNG